jgi:hypothetical protein
MFLDYDNLVIGADSDDSEDLEWLAEFLCPSFRRLDAFASRVADCRVRLVRDPAAFARWEDRLKSAGDLRTRAFLLDTGPVNLGTIPDGDALVAHDDFFNVFFRWSPATGRNAVDIIDGDPVNLEEASHARRARVPLMRAVREWAMHHAFRRGRGFLHAAAVVREGKALLLAGPKRSGKTSLLTAILQARTDVAYLANDRVMVSRLDAGVVCRGMPSIVSVRPGMPNFLPDFEARIGRVACGHTSRRLESTKPVVFADGRFGLSPPQFFRLVGTRPAAEGELAAIAFPRISPGVGTVEVNELSKDEAAARLAEAVFGLAGAGLASAIFDIEGSGPYPGRATMVAAAAQLANDARCFDVGLGMSAYRPEIIDGLLDEMFVPRQVSS